MAINRRDFMKWTAGAVASGYLGGASPTYAAETGKAQSMRPLGQTGIDTTFLGMGTGVRAARNESALIRRGDEQFMEVLERAYGHGVRFFDLADMYGSHEYLRRAMDDFMDREEIMILTKTMGRDPETVTQNIDRFRQELDTDTIDVLLLHCLTRRNWTENLPEVMDVMSEAKEQGLIRAHGVSCHDWGAMETAVESDWTDVILARINPYESHMDGPFEDVKALLQRAHEKGIGVLGMKILGEGTLADQKESCFEFAAQAEFLDAVTIGFLSTDEVDDAIEQINRHAT